jgi:hypothetical protein
MRGAALLALVALGACSSSEQPAAPQPSETPAPVAASATAPTAASAAAAPNPTPAPQPVADPAVLDSRDCRTVAQAYLDALARGDFAFAAQVWDDPVIDEARLRALFTAYRQPTIAFAGVEQVGAAGSLYCTVSGTLTDAGQPAKAAQKGEIVFKRVNDVPGASARQLRWTIRSSTFVEKMERTG